MQPHFHEAAKIFHEDETVKPDKQVMMVKVDATAEEKLAKRFRIKAYPTVKIFRRGKPYDYEGPQNPAKGKLS